VVEGPLGAVVVVGDVSEMERREGNEDRLGASSGDGVGGVLFDEPNLLLFLSGGGVGEVHEGIGGDESGRLVPTSSGFRIQCCVCCFFGSFEEEVVVSRRQQAAVDGRLWRPECYGDGVSV
jgi:hypothetical protein